LTYIQKYLEIYGYKTQHSSIIHGIDAAKTRLADDIDYARIVSTIQKSVTF
jgi:hypothetical protein